MILLFVASIVAVALILFFGKKLKPKMRGVWPRHDVASRSML